MIERLEHLGVREMTLAEQGEVLGGSVARVIGQILGFIVGAATVVLDQGYDNPRYSGGWVG